MTDSRDGTAFSSRMLQANLGVLEVLSPSLARLLVQSHQNRNDVETDILPNGYPVARATLRNRLIPLYLTEDPVQEMQAWVASLPDPQPDVRLGAWILVGCGLGYELKALMRQLPPTLTLWVYEPDPFFLLMTLSRLDCSDALIDGRLRLVAGMNMQPLVDGLRGSFGQRTTLRLLVQPQLEPLLRWEALALTAKLEYELGATVESQLQVASALSPLPIELGAQRQRPLRVCLAKGGLFFEDMAYAWTQRGDELHILHTDRLIGHEIIDELLRMKADVVVSVDLINGMGDVCAQVGIPYLVWEINPRVWVPLNPTGAAAAFTHIFTYRLKNVPWYKAMGYQHVEHLVLATTPEWRRPMEISHWDREKYRAATSFVGNSLIHEDQADYQLAQATLKRLATTGEPSEQRRWLGALTVIHEAVELQSRDLLQPLVIERIEQGFARLGLSCELPVQDKPGEEVLDLRIIYSRLFGSRRRRQALETLAPFGVAVYGDPGWERIPMKGVYFRGPAEHGNELTTIYNVTQINLDVGRLYQLDIVTMRVFDILAAGGFALVEYSQELPLVLEPGHEVIAWRDWTELRELADYYLSHPQERQDVIERGRSRVLREHTIVARVQHMVQVMQARGALPGGRPAGVRRS